MPRPIQSAVSPSIRTTKLQKPKPKRRGAAALIAIDDYLRLAGGSALIPLQTTVPTVLDVIIGCVTFTGSLIASGKLMGLIPGRPIVIPGGRIVTVLAALAAIAGAVYLFAGNVSSPVLFAIIAAGLIFGITMVLPIGDATSQTLTLVENVDGQMKTTSYGDCSFVKLVGKYAWDA